MGMPVHMKFPHAPLFLTLTQAMAAAFLLSSVNFGTEGGDPYRRLSCLGISFALSILACWFIRNECCSEGTIALLTFISRAAFSLAFNSAPGPACIVQSSRFIFFFKIHLHLSLLLNMLNCAVISACVVLMHRKNASGAIYSEKSGIFAHVGDSMSFIIRKSRIVLIIGFTAGLAFLAFGAFVFLPLLNCYFHFLLRCGLFYNSALELLTDFIFMNLSNWTYTMVTGILAAAFVYNSSVMLCEDEGQLSALHSGRLALHKMSAASTRASPACARRLSEYIELEFARANAILDDIQKAAIQYENNAFMNLPQVSKCSSSKIRTYDVWSHLSAYWTYRMAMLALPLQYHEVSFSLCRVISYFTKFQSQAVRRDVALQKVPAMFEALLERERLLEKRCSIDLESRRLSHLLKLFSSM